MLERDGVFSAYMKIVQLPNEVKRLNKIKLNPKNPRFDLVAVNGYFPPLEALKYQGHVHFNLVNGKDRFKEFNNRKPFKVLQDNRGFNFSGIFLDVCGTVPVDGCFVGYGNPNPDETCLIKGKEIKNPYFENGRDGFLFIIKQDFSEIEIFVLPKGGGGDNIIESATAAFRYGVYDEQVRTLREAAKVFHTYKGQ